MTVVPGSAVPVIVTILRLVVPPTLLIVIGNTGGEAALNVSSELVDGVEDGRVAEPLPALVELTNDTVCTRLPVTFAEAESEKTVVVGGSLGSIGGLPAAAVLVDPGLELF